MTVILTVWLESSLLVTELISWWIISGIKRKWTSVHLGYSRSLLLAPRFTPWCSNRDTHTNKHLEPRLLHQTLQSSRCCCWFGSCCNKNKQQWKCFCRGKDLPNLLALCMSACTLLSSLLLPDISKCICVQMCLHYCIIIKVNGVKRSMKWK